MTTLCEEISTRLTALNNCRKNDNTEWVQRHEERLTQLEDMLPSGAGLDQKPTIVRTSANHYDTRIHIHGAYHHMNSDGFYVGWTSFVLCIEATFQGINVDVERYQPHWKKGLDEDESQDPDELWNDVVDYICETYQEALTQVLDKA